ncbi:MAG TPA: hypothetical protein VGF45_12360 [Polyangia bacterium]
MSDEPTRGPCLMPEEVAARLQRLRNLAVLETVEQGRERLARETPRVEVDFATAVRGRLRELRALLVLTEHLHKHVRSPPRSPQGVD